MTVTRLAHLLATTTTAVIGVFLFSSLSAAPIDFVEQPSLAGPGVSSAQSYVIADLDSDADNDIVSVSAISGSLVYFENLGTSFAPPRVIGEASSPRSLAVTDLDNDGLPDILVTDLSLGEIFAFFNQGANVFSPPVTVTGSANGPIDIDTADFDGDGDTDVVYINFAGDTVSYVENLGSRNFAQPQNLPTSVDGPQEMDIGDINGDGEPDVLVASSFDDTVGWFPSNGDGTFGTRQVISTATANPRGAELGDIDGDGTLDVISFPSNGLAVTYYFNNGSGGFGTEQRFNFVSPNRVIGISVDDFDGDGDNDVAYSNQITNGDDDISYLVNNGSGALGSPVPVVTNLTTGFTFAAGNVLGSSLPDVVYLDDFVHIDVAVNQAGAFATPIRLTPAIAGAVAVQEIGRAHV